MSNLSSSPDISSIIGRRKLLTVFCLMTFLGALELNAFNSGTEPLSASIATPTDVSCNGQADGALTASASDGTAPYTYSWSNGQTVAAISGFSAGTYTVSVTDANGCGPDIQQATLSDPPITLMISEFLTNPFGIESNSEWIEIHNYGSAGIDINGFKLKDEDSDNDVIASSSTIIPAGGYLIIAKNKSNFESIWFGGNAISNVVQVRGVTISNTTDELILTDASDNVIWSLAYADDETEGRATWISTATNTPTTWGSKASPGIVRDGNDVSGSIGYEKNNATADPLAFTNTDGDTGSPLNGTVLFANSTVNNNVSCNGASDGSLTASAFGGVNPYTYSWNNGATTATTNSLVASNYTVTVTDANGLTATSSSTITEPDALVANASVASNVSCNGLSDGGVTANPTGGTTPYTYSWNTGATSASPSGLAANTYTVTIIDANGCTDSQTATITQPTVLVANASVASNVSCNGLSDGGVTASPTGGTTPYTYSWNTGATSASPSGLAANTYTVTVTDANGCTDSQTATITQPTALVANASVASNVSCNGLSDGGVTASPTGGTSPYTYSWNTGATSASPSGLAANTYTVTVTDANGCTDSQTATITEPTALSAASVVDQNVSINGGSDGQVTASGSGGTGPYTYSWNTGSTSATTSGLPAGTYTVSVTDNNGCGPATDQVTITEPVVLTALSIVDSNVDCNGGSDGGATASATGGITPYTYSWNNGVTTASITGQVASTYTVTVTDANGATSTSSSTITEPTALSAAGVVDMNVSINGGNDGQATAAGSGGTPPYTYSWNNGQTTATATGLSAGTYTVSVTDNNGCGPATDQVTITEPVVLTALSIVDSNVDCNGGSDGGATASATGGITPYTYSWNNGVTTASITGQVASTYTVTVTDANGATSTSSSTITEPTALSAAGVVDMNVSINGGNDGQATAAGSGGTPPYTYSWNNGQTTATATGLSAGTYTVSVTDNNGCGPATDQVTITEPVVLTALSIVDSNVDCNGGSDGGATASATGGITPYTYSWNNGVTTASITGQVASTYTVTVTDANGATSTSSSTITQPTALSAAGVVDMNVSINGGNDGQATAAGSGGTPPYTYSWNNGQTTATATGLSAGTYTVSVTDNNGCGPATDQVTITEPVVLTALSMVDFNVNCNGGSDGGASASASGGTQPYTYTWSNGATTESITNSTAGTYTVTVTDANGATSTSSSTITQPTALSAAGVVDMNVSINGGNDGQATAAGSGGTPPYTYSWNNGQTTATATGLSAGTYTVSVTDNNGCGPATDQVTITEPVVLTALSIVDSNVDCNGGSDGGATASATGGITPYTYSWNNGVTTASITGQVASAYTVTVTDANGATSTSSSTITQPTALSAAGVVDMNVSINGGNDGQATAAGSGGTPPYTYSWNNGQTTATATGLSAGTYTVSVTDNNGCGPATDQVTITEPVVLTALSMVDFNVNCNGGSDGGASASASGGTQPYTYTWSNGATTESITNSTAGTYTVTVTDANGATSTSSSTITQPTALSAAGVVDMNVSINGGNDGQATAAGSGGTPPYTYSWNNGQTTATATGLSAGTYTVSVTDNNGCGPATDQVTITQPAPNTNPSFISTAVTNVVAGDTYSYVIKTSDAEGNTVTITAPTKPAWLSLSAEVGGQVSTIAGSGAAGSVDGTGTDAVFNFPAGVAVDAANNIYVIDQDNHLIRKIDVQGIVSTFAGNGVEGFADGTATAASFDDPKDIAIDSNGNLIIADFQNHRIRKISQAGMVSTIAGSGGTGLVNGTGTNAVFNFPAGVAVDDGDNIYVVDQDNHIIRKIDAQGIVSTFAGNGVEGFADGTATAASFNDPKDIAIDSNGNLIIADFENHRIRKISQAGMVSTIAGSGGTGLVNGTGTNAAFNFPAGVAVDDGDNIYVVDQDNHIIRKIDGQGVVSTYVGSGVEGFGNGEGSNVQFDNPKDIAIDRSGNLVVADFANNRIRLITTECYVLSGNSNGESGDHPVVLSANDGNGGTAEQSFTITVNAVLSVSTSVDTNASCNGFSDGGATANPSGGTSPYTYSWSNGATNASITGLLADTYTVTVTDNNGATSTSQATITEPNALIANASTDNNVSVHSGADGQVSASPTGGTAPYTYAWSNGATNAIESNLTAGNYTVTVTDSNGCTSSESAQVTEPSALVISTQITDVSCNSGADGSVTASSTGGTSPYTYLWSNGATNATISGEAAGTYTVTVTDNNGGTASKSAMIDEPSAVVANAATDNNVSVHSGADGQVSASPTGGTSPYTYVWSNGATNAVESNLTAGTYTVTVTDNNGCTSSESTQVTEPSALVISTQITDVSCNSGADGSVTASSTGGTSPYTYLWSNGSTNATISSETAGTYTVTVTDNNGGTASKSAMIDEPSAVVVNAATDNNVSVHSGADGQVSASPTGGTSPYTYQWSNGATNAIVNTLPAGTYTVTVTDNNGCTSSESTQVTEPSALVVSTQITDVSCNSGADGAATANPTGGTSPYTYLWSNGSTNATISSETAGTYTVTVTDNNGGTASKSAMINEPSALFANAVTDQNVTIHGGSDGQVSISPSGGTAPYTYSWGTGATTATVSGLPAGNYSVSVIDNNGCSAFSSTTVTEPANTNPVFNSDPVTSVNDNEHYAYRPRILDNEGDPVTISSNSLPSWLSLGITPEGIVTTFAGSGASNDTNGTGTEATFSFPVGMTIDGAGNIYVAASGQIRVITPEGVVSTLQVNDGLGSTESYDDGADRMVFDATGNLYVTVPGHNQINKITPSGDVSTFAGGGSGTVDGTGTDATFNNPRGITIDGAGNLYVTDERNDLIRKITPSGVVSTFAGTAGEFSFPYGITIGAAGNLYVVDTGNSKIKKVTPGGVVTTLAGAGNGSADGTGTAATFSYPTGIAIDNEGNLIIADQDNNKVRKITPAGVVTTLAGSGSEAVVDGTGTSASFAYLNDVVVDGLGNIFVSDLNGNVIRKIDASVQELSGDPTNQVGTHSVILDASDGNGGTAQQAFTLTVADATAPEFNSGTAESFAENGTGVAHTVSATDSNTKSSVTFDLGSGNDEALFGINQNEVSFSIPPDFESPIDGGNDNTYIIEVIARDDANNESKQLVTITVTDVQEDITAPDKPVITGISDDTGSSATDGITSDRNLLIHGTAEALATVEVFSPGGKIGTTQADANGHWTLDITAFTLPEMMSNTTADAIDAAQNRSATSDIFVITIDFTAPAKPVVTGISDDTGSSNSDGVTSDRNLLIHGTAEADAIVDVFSPGGKIGTTQADANGDWTLDITAFNLQEINSNTTAEAVDLAGNRSATSDGFVINVDFTAPAKPVITGISDDTGSNSSDGITSDRNLLIHGTAEANVEVEIFSPGGSIGVVPADANGDWTLDISRFNLPEFTADMTAEAIDLAGNRSAASDPFTLTIDFTAPSKPVITGISDDTGSSNSDGITSDRNLLIHGTAEANVEVEIFSPGGSIGVVPADANGDWTLDISRFNLPEFTANMTAEAIDLAGNRSAASDMFTLTIDFTAPSKPVITGISDDTGSSSSDGITSDRNLLIHGTAEANAHVEVFSPGGSIGVVPADANGDWTLDISRFNLPEFTANMTAEAIDLAGNRSVASDMFTLTIDFTSPGVTIDIANNSVAGYQVTALFDEEVSGLTLAEITVVNGTASALVQDSPMSYSFLVNSSGSSADVTVNANAAEDLAGNGNTVSNQLTLGFTPVSAGEDFSDLQKSVKAEVINIYPNPASKVLTIDLSELSAEEVDIYMYDAAGAPVLTREGYKEKTLRVDVSNYTSGLYIVQFYDGTNVIRKKVMVKK